VGVCYWSRDQFLDSHEIFFKESVMKKFILTAMAIVAIATVSASATVQFTTATNGPISPSSTTDELAYAGDISSSDLLDGIVGVTGGAAFGANGSSPAGLNDGINGGDYEDLGLPALVGAAWPSTGSYIDFDLGVGTGLGYNITEIQSISAWQDLGLNNQNYDVLVKYLGDAGFTALTTVTYQPFNSGGGAVKVNVTDDTGVLASGIEGIRFDFLATAGHTAGSVYREIDVMGTPTPEPATMALLGLGALALRRRRND
jgi:MYXO-CTERM domain-containing protein